VWRCRTLVGYDATLPQGAHPFSALIWTRVHPFTLVNAYFGRGTVFLLKGNPEEAIRVFERGVTVCQVWEVRVWFPPLASGLGAAYARSGRSAEAIPLLEQAVEEATSRGVTWSQSFSLAALGEAYLLAGRIGEAMQRARGALDLAVRYAERGNRAWIMRLLADIASRSDPPDLETAEGHYRQALALATELGMRPLVAHCHFGLGRLNRRTGKDHDAHEHLGTATAMYREMDMEFWRTQAEAELGLLG